MPVRPRFFPSGLGRRERRVYRLAVAVFVAIFCALIWPVYPRFAGIEPRVLGLPFSMFYVVCFLLISFAALFGVFVWEGRGCSAGADEPSAPGGGRPVSGDR